MEFTDSRRSLPNTMFNVDIHKQFIPYWNGLMHLVGKVENNVITQRHDWKNIIQECELFEKDYLNTSGFCESCVFHDIPDYVDTLLETNRQTGITDCKQIAGDNDIVYTYCITNQRFKKKLWLIIMSLFLMVSFISFLFWKKYHHPL